VDCYTWKRKSQSVNSGSGNDPRDGSTCCSDPPRARFLPEFSFVVGWPSTTPVAVLG
jgi:hypothetical protein